MLPIPKSNLHAIRSLVSSFINRRIFPRLGWHVLTASKKVGGLGILDPELQHSALYYRWLDPLLSPRTGHSLIHEFLRAHLRNAFHSLQPLIGLLFPRARPNASTGTSLTAVSLVCRTMDIISRCQFTYIPKPLECLVLPLRAVVIPSATFRLSPILRDALVSDLYHYHPLGHYLTPI